MFYKFVQTPSHSIWCSGNLELFAPVLISMFCAINIYKTNICFYNPRSVLSEIYCFQQYLINWNGRKCRSTFILIGIRTLNAKYLKYLQKQKLLVLCKMCNVCATCKYLLLRLEVFKTRVHKTGLPLRVENHYSFCKSFNMISLILTTVLPKRGRRKRTPRYL